jgi:hypothetical protein
MSRTNRSRIVVGSIVGAFAIHIAALACSGNGSVVGAPDASMSDAGQVVAHDGGVLDVIASALDALGDAARDVATQVVDSEVRDARAGGDAGTGGECQCVRPTSSTFSFTLDRGRGPETPVARFSTASGSVTLGIGTGGVTGPAVYQTTAFAMGYLADGTRFQVVFQGTVNREGVSLAVPTATLVLWAPVGGDAGTSPIFGAGATTVAGASVPALANERWEFRASSAVIPAGSDGGTFTLRDFVFRQSAPGGHLLDEPTPAYRP